MATNYKSRIPNSDDLPERLLPKKKVREIVGVSDMTLSRWEEQVDEDGEPLFPRRIQIGPNRVAWRQSEILAWIKRREQITARELANSNGRDGGAEPAAIVDEGDQGVEPDIVGTPEASP